MEKKFTDGIPITRIAFFSAQIRACQIRLDNALAQSIAAQTAVSEAQEALSVASQALESVVLESFNPSVCAARGFANHKLPCAVALGTSNVKSTSKKNILLKNLLAKNKTIIFNKPRSDAELL